MSQIQLELTNLKPVPFDRKRLDRISSQEFVDAFLESLERFNCQPLMFEDSSGLMVITTTRAPISSLLNTEGQT